jgi:type II secretory pathway component PulF
MPKSFIYSARTREGLKQTGIIQADNPERAAAILDDQQLIPTDIIPQKQNQKPILFGFLKGRLYEDLILFTRNLSSLYQAGIPLLKALSIIKIGSPDSYFNQTIEKIRNEIQSGKALSEVMAESPEIFSKIYTSSVAAGEMSGKLDMILDSLGNMLERDLELNRQIKSSLRYPIIVISAIAMAFAVVITFVIPRFVQFYSGLGAQLPAPTRILIWLNQFITSYWMLMIAGAIILAFIIRKTYSSTSGRLFFDTLFLRVPVFGDLIIKGNIARFSYMFHLLLKSGIPIVKSLELLADTVKNVRLSLEIRMLADSFREGRELGGLVDRVVFFPEMALQMIRVGLESGSVENMLNEVAIYYSKEVDYKSRHLTALLEPILTVVLGIFVLIVALAIFLPMWNLIHIFKG